MLFLIEIDNFIIQNQKYLYTFTYGEACKNHNDRTQKKTAVFEAAEMGFLNIELCEIM